MAIPHSERVIFGRNPLKEVICQLRFPTVLEISASEPAAFQNRIRDVYPLYERIAADVALTSLPAEIGKLISQLGLPASSTATHEFSTEDRKTKVTLSNDFVAVSTQDYREWNVFLTEIGRAEDALQVFRPAFFTRLGLRYQDVIDRADLDLTDRRWSELIKPAFLGFMGLEDVQDDILSSAAESIFTLPDIDGGKVKVRLGLAKGEGSPAEVFLFDADFYSDTKCGGSDAIDRLKALHSHAGDLFRWVITDRLYDALGPAR